MHGNFITATTRLMGHAFVLMSSDTTESERARSTRLQRHSDT